MGEKKRLDADGVIVQECEEPTVFWDRAEFVCTDARPNPDETVDGYALIHLSNGRAVRINRTGLMDAADWDKEADERGEDFTFGEVNWDELLQLLDAFRAGNRAARLN